MSRVADRRVVIGIGNPDRGDDAVGRVVASTLRAMVAPDVRVEQCAGEATQLLGLLQEADHAWLIDAAQSSDTPAGTVHRLNAVDQDLPYVSATTSSHGFGLGEAIALGRTLGYLPRHCVIFAIEAESFAAGAQLTAPVARAVAEVTAAILGELQQEDVSSHA